MPSRIKIALAENTAHMKVLADRYVQIMARAEREIEAEKQKPSPSAWKIQALEYLRDRAEDNIARFKGGPDHMEEWLANAERDKIGD